MSEHSDASENVKSHLTKQEQKKVQHAVDEDLGDDQVIATEEKPQNKRRRLKRVIEEENSGQEPSPAEEPAAELKARKKKKSRKPVLSEQSDDQEILQEGEHEMGLRKVGLRAKNRVQYIQDHESSKDDQEEEGQNEDLQQEIQDLKEDNAAFDLDEPQTKKEQKKNAKKPAKKKKEAAKINPNLVKTTNKLLGEVEIGNLYAEDDGKYNTDAFGGQTSEQEEVRHNGNADLDFGNFNRKKQEVPQRKEFLNKFQKQESATGMNDQSIQMLGFQDKATANELAARGVKMCIKDDLIENLKQQISNENQDQKNSPEVSPLVNTQFQNKSIEIQPQNDKKQFVENDEEFLDFYDPVQEERERLQKQKLEKEKDKPVKMVMLNGKMVPMQASNFVGSAQPAASGSRQAMLNNLQNKVAQKQKTVDLDYVKSTFQVTDLNSKTVKKNRDIEQDALLQEIEGLSDDSEYDPDKKEEDQKDMAKSDDDQYMKSDEEEHWDDEENFVQKNDKSMSSASLVSDGDIADAIKSSSEEAQSQQAKSDKEGEKSNANDSDEDEAALVLGKQQKQMAIEQLKKQKQRNKDRKRMKMFMEDEAELGSDNEDNDHRRKRINSQDEDEDEEGLDEDLKDFVVYGEKNEGADEEALREKFYQDMKDDDKVLTSGIFKSVILGQNAKRKRGQVDLDELDELSKRKNQRLEERMGNQDSDEEDDFLACEEARRQQQIRDLADEDELSDSEIRKQMEENDFFQFKKEMERTGEAKFVRRYVNTDGKEAKEEADLEKCMVDLNQNPNDSKQSMRSITSSNLANLETAVTPSLNMQFSEDERMKSSQFDTQKSKTKKMLPPSTLVTNKNHIKGGLAGKKRIALEMGLAENYTVKQPLQPSNSFKSNSTNATDVSAQTLKSGLAPNKLFAGRNKLTSGYVPAASRMQALVKTGANIAQGPKTNKIVSLAGSMLTRKAK